MSRHPYADPREHQVVVVFDVTAPDLLAAGRRVARLLSETGEDEPDSRVESWWMPEEPLRSQVDRNDNLAGRLVFAEPEDCPACGAYPGSRHHPDCPRMLARFSRAGEDTR